MFGIGSTELLIIFIVALVVLGPKSIPKIAKTIGKAMGDFKRVSTEFQRTMNVEAEMEEHEERKKEAEEELFGSKKESKSANSKDSSKDVKKTAQNESDKSNEPNVKDQDVKDQDVAKASADAADNTNDPASEKIIEADSTISDDSALAQAVNKAESEANPDAKAQDKEPVKDSLAQEKSKDTA